MSIIAGAIQKSSICVIHLELQPIGQEYTKV